MLAAHPDLTVITGADQAITGAVQAVADAGLKDKVKLVGYGGGAIAFQGIASGERFGTVMQAPATEGGLGVQMFIDAIRTGVAAPGIDVLADLPDGGVVTKDNVEDVPDRSRSGRAEPAERARADGARRGPPGHPRDRQVVRRHPSAATTSPSRSEPAPFTPSSARTEPASPPSARSSPASSRPTRASSSSRASRSASARRARRSSAASPSSPRRSRSSRSGPSRRTSSSGPSRGASASSVAARLLERFERVVADAGFEVPADASVGALPLAKQQQVEILRALARDAELIVFDEPTAALSAVEVRALPRDRPRPRGQRPDGHPRVALPRARSSSSPTRSRSSATARSSGPRPPPTRPRTRSWRRCSADPSAGPTRPSVLPPTDAPVALTVRTSRRSGVDGASLEVRAGEIVGLAGLVGAGTVGARPRDLRRRPGDGDRVDRRRPSRSEARRSGRSGRTSTMIPESRKDDGLMLRRPVRENVSLASLAQLRSVRVRPSPARGGIASGDALTSVSASSRLETTPEALSGGNQQKLMFARALLAEPAVLIADEPTRGVDVGAKRDLYQLHRRARRRGVAVLLISNEIEEILGLAHRVLVMRAGRVVAELDGDEDDRGGDPGRVVRQGAARRRMTEASAARASRPDPALLGRLRWAIRTRRHPDPVHHRRSSSSASSARRSCGSRTSPTSSTSRPGSSSSPPPARSC